MTSQNTSNYVDVRRFLGIMGLVFLLFGLFVSAFGERPQIIKEWELPRNLESAMKASSVIFMFCSFVSLVGMILGRRLFGIGVAAVASGLIFIVIGRILHENPIVAGEIRFFWWNTLAFYLTVYGWIFLNVVNLFLVDRTQKEQEVARPV